MTALIQGIMFIKPHGSELCSKYDRMGDTQHNVHDQRCKPRAGGKPLNTDPGCYTTCVPWGTKATQSVGAWYHVETHPQSQSDAPNRADQLSCQCSSCFNHKQAVPSITGHADSDNMTQQGPKPHLQGKPWAFSSSNMEFTRAMPGLAAL